MTPERLTELEEELDAGLVTGYKPWDQAERISDWADADWRKLPAKRILKRNADIEAWEKAHGHDCRLKCYPEFNCAAIESRFNEVALELIAAVRHLTTKEDRTVEQYGVRLDGDPIDAVETEPGWDRDRAERHKRMMDSGYDDVLVRRMVTTSPWGVVTTDETA